MCVTSPEDIINDLKGLLYQEIKGENIEDENVYSNAKSDDDLVILKKTINKNSLAPAEKMLYSCLSLEPTYIDDIIDKLKMGVSETINLLYNMEEKGLIKQSYKGYYIISV